MDESLILKMTAIATLGMGAQWLAWRAQLPAIVLLSIAGILAGPVFGLVRPTEDFGALLSPMISVAVAIILFEGGLNLNVRELRETSVAVRRLVVVGVPLSWGLTTLAAHHLAGLSWGVAAVLGGILVVTGPTVILPMLRQAKLTARPASVLKWEGIVNDPIGALLAVLVFGYLSVDGRPETLLDAGWLVLAALFAIGLGVALGRGVVRLFARGMVPEHLKAGLLLVVVLVGFAGANLLQGESGLLTVTALGITLANARFASLEEMRRFKENLTILLVSAVFVLLTASLHPSTLPVIGDEGKLAFIACVLFVIRPLVVWISTIRCGLSWQERALIGWIAPRGVVAVAVAGFFAARLQDQGYADAASLVPIVFAIVFATVVAHGFSIRYLARRLGLSASGRPGVLIVGSSDWSAALATTLQGEAVPVRIIDSDWLRLRAARSAGVPLHFGEVLSEAATYHLGLSRYHYLLAVSDNDAYNAFVCTHMAPHFGRERVFQLGVREEEESDRRGFAVTARGRTLLGSGADLSGLLDRHRAGWTFQRTRLTEVYGWEQYLAGRPDGAETLFVICPGGELVVDTDGKQPPARAGDVVIGFAPPRQAADGARCAVSLSGDGNGTAAE